MLYCSRYAVLYCPHPRPLSQRKRGDPIPSPLRGKVRKGVRPGLTQRRDQEEAMDFGMFMEFGCRQGGTQAEAFKEGFKLVDAAEQWGLDGAWLAELHFNPTRSV